MSADVGRAAVYAAEIAAFDGTAHEVVVPLAHLVELADRVTGSAWWPLPPVAVRAARADAHSSTTRQRQGGAPVVRLAAPQLTAATLVHELAHVLAGVGEGHGPRFRRAHVDLAGAVLGAAEAGWLADAYAAAALPIGPRRWPVPPLGPGAPIAL